MSSIGNGLILSGISGMVTMGTPVYVQVPCMVVGFIVGAMFPNF